MAVQGRWQAAHDLHAPPPLATPLSATLAAPLLLAQLDPAFFLYQVGVMLCPMHSAAGGQSECTAHSRSADPPCSTCTLV